MDTQQSGRRIPRIQFRVLIVGRANAGKTSILQRVCETTESPIIYRGGGERVTLDPSIDRGEHNIDDELLFSNHKGYVFHDSRGIESGSVDELRILQQFIQRKCHEKRLRDRLHAIWFCVPMDNQRPQLDLTFFHDICPDRNVPVIALFTKFDQFRRNVEMQVMDYPNEYPDAIVSEVVEKQFQEHYLSLLGDGVKFVRLEKMNRPNTHCNDLIENTAASLNGDIVELMLLAVQRRNLELSVRIALNRVHSHTGSVENKEDLVRRCLIPFPYLWLFPSPEFQVQPSSDFPLRELPEPGNELFGPGEDPEELGGEPERQLIGRGFRTGLPSRFGPPLNRFTMRVMSLPTIQNVIGLSSDHLILAVVLIFKHATFLRLSDLSPESALTRTELDYRVANVDLKINQYLTASRSHSVALHEDFIMATDIAQSITATDIEPAPRPALSIMATGIEHGQSSVEARVDKHWFKRFWEPVLPCKTIFSPKSRSTIRK